MWYLFDTEIRVMFFFIGAIFYMIYIVQVKSMCVPILRAIGSELTNNWRSYGWNSGFRVFGDLDLDLWSMSYFFCHTHCAWCTGISMRRFIKIRPVWIGDMLRLKFWKRPMLHNGVFGCHGNTCYVIFIGAIFYMLYSGAVGRMGLWPLSPRADG